MVNPLYGHGQMSLWLTSSGCLVVGGDGEGEGRPAKAEGSTSYQGETGRVPIAMAAAAAAAAAGVTGADAKPKLVDASARATLSAGQI